MTQNMIIYNTLYELLETHIFGSVIEGTYPDLVLIICATIGSLFVVSLPFLIVYNIIRIIGRW